MLSGLNRVANSFGVIPSAVAPWRSVYKLRLFTDRDLTFILTKGSHNGGILSEPGHRKQHYRNDHRPPDGLYTSQDDWLADSIVQEGSWWSEMAKCLKRCSRTQVVPPSIWGERSLQSPSAARARDMHSTDVGLKSADLGTSCRKCRTGPRLSERPFQRLDFGNFPRSSIACS